MTEQHHLNTSFSNWKKLTTDFYERTDVVAITKELLGKILVTNFEDKLTAGRIVEAEAYNGPFDKAAHSYNNRRTARTEVMFSQGGVAYIYLCYGIHQMFNIVTNVKDVPNAILIRALEPLAGINVMLERTNKATHTFDLTRGPGNVAKALGLHTSQSGMTLQSDPLYIADDGYLYPDDDIIATSRIGVDYAAEDALLPYRFVVKGNKYVSGKKIIKAKQ
ncbi:DNA-3-methyladenine glycosylase [Segetibacter sp.]|uniref:DNA-3-methyladenine glycosylase n=1 Tax=Segetibacter sp. TaxID=2231182 RepID=UPI002621BF2E|nr:DNA-3-methyladenine glycosylase [Segetibacter sp.]MCW3078786.1 3-methyladenine glycosylase [Segetibacter sp.]